MRRGRRRNANSHAVLLANPHLLWSDRFFWYEAQLQAGGVNIYGATLVGFLGLVIAFNDCLG
ncbi:penicillin acylase family protein [Chroogloeocystis siderophila]|uniref:penicillin acylase family protein n=1 Tax=Chroogloeocystis siderophila TaxID=329163 RepID=UPI001F029F27|nr:penicillin acylase family protein [Chroogloeocystis siderophila]